MNSSMCWLLMMSRKLVRWIGCQYFLIESTTATPLQNILRRWSLFLKPTHPRIEPAIGWLSPLSRATSSTVAQTCAVKILFRSSVLMLLNAGIVCFSRNSSHVLLQSAILFYFLAENLFDIIASLLLDPKSTWIVCYLRHKQQFSTIWANECSALLRFRDPHLFYGYYNV